MHDSDEESSNVEARLVIRVVEDKLTKNRVEWILYKTSLQKIQAPYNRIQDSCKIPSNEDRLLDVFARSKKARSRSIELSIIIDSK